MMGAENHMAKLATNIATALSSSDRTEFTMTFGRDAAGELELSLHDSSEKPQADIVIKESAGVMTNDYLAEEMIISISYEQ